MTHTDTSPSMAGNIPLALLLVASVRWGLRTAERQQRLRLLAARQGTRGWWHERQEGPPLATPPELGVPSGAARPEAWRTFVRAPVVEEAWSKFCGSIVQEFIYDTFYASLTPDREFPAEVGAGRHRGGCTHHVGWLHAAPRRRRRRRRAHGPTSCAQVRRLLNTGFGQLASRARQLDLRAAMNDLSELFMEQVIDRRPWELTPATHYVQRRPATASCPTCTHLHHPPVIQLELYRDTRDSILLATQQPHCLRDMSAAARDRALQREMRAEKNLHPALQTPDGHYRVGAFTGAGRGMPKRCPWRRARSALALPARNCCLPAHCRTPPPHLLPPAPSSCARCRRGWWPI